MTKPDSGFTELLPSTRVGRREFLGADIGSRLVLMNIDKGSYIALDSFGAAIWERLEQPVTIAALCEQLQAAYEADPAVLLRDVVTFLQQLRLQGLIDVSIR